MSIQLLRQFEKDNKRIILEDANANIEQSVQQLANFLRQRFFYPQAKFPARPYTAIAFGAGGSEGSNLPVGASIIDREAAIEDVPTLASTGAYPEINPVALIDEEDGEQSKFLKKKLMSLGMGNIEAADRNNTEQEIKRVEQHLIMSIMAQKVTEKDFVALDSKALALAKFFAAVLRKDDVAVLEQHAQEFVTSEYKGQKIYLNQRVLKYLPASERENLPAEVDHTHELSKLLIFGLSVGYGADNDTKKVSGNRPSLFLFMNTEKFHFKEQKMGFMVQVIRPMFQYFVEIAALYRQRDQMQAQSKPQ